MFSKFSKSVSTSEAEDLLGNLRSDSPTSKNIVKDKNSPLLQGILTKESSKVKSWKRRYFVLYKDRLEYYSIQEENSRCLSPRKDKLLKSIPLAKGQLVSRAPEKSFTNYYCFKWITQQRCYYFVASNENEMEQWINTLKSTLLALPNEDQSEESVDVINGNRYDIDDTISFPKGNRMIEGVSDSFPNYSFSASPTASHIISSTTSEASLQVVVDKFPKSIATEFTNEIQSRSVKVYHFVTYNQPHLLTLKLPGTLFILKEYLLFYSKVMTKESILYFNKSELSVISVVNNSIRISIPNKGTFLFTLDPGVDNSTEVDKKLTSLVKDLTSRFNSQIIIGKDTSCEKQSVTTSPPNLEEELVENSNSVDKTTEGIISDGFSDEFNSFQRSASQQLSFIHLNLDEELKINTKFRATFNKLYQMINKDVFQKNLPESEVIQLRVFCYYEDNNFGYDIRERNREYSDMDVDTILTVNEEINPRALYSATHVTRIKSNSILYGQLFVTNNYFWFLGRLSLDSPRVQWVIPFESVESIHFTEISLLIKTFSADREKIIEEHTIYLLEEEPGVSIQDQVLSMDVPAHWDLQNLGEYIPNFSTPLQNRNFNILMQLHNIFFTSKPPLTILVPTIEQEDYIPLQYRLEISPHVDGITSFSEYLSQADISKKGSLEYTTSSSAKKNVTVKLIPNYFSLEYLDKHKDIGEVQLQSIPPTTNSLAKFDPLPHCSIISYYSLQCFRSWGKQNIHLVILQNFQNGEMIMQLIPRGKSKPFKQSNFKEMSCILRDHKDKSIFYISFGSKKRWKFMQTDPIELQKIVEILDRINKQAKEMSG